MWLITTGLVILGLIILAALVSDIRRRRHLRALDEHPVGRGVDAAARRGRAELDVTGGPTSARIRRNTDVGDLFSPNP